MIQNDGARFRPGPPAPQRHSTARVIMGIVLIVGAALVISLGINAFSGRDATPTGTPSATPDPEPIGRVWTFTLESLSDAPADATLAYSLNGAFTGPRVIEGDLAWAAIWTSGAEYTPSGVVAIDPASGAALWHRALPEVMCADRQVENTLLCVAHEEGSWVYHRIDTLTGADVAAAELTLDAVQTIHTNGAVLVAVGPADPAPHAELAGLGLDGVLLWERDIATIEGADVLFTTLYENGPQLERPRWRDLDGGLVMLWSTPGLAIIDPATGTTFAHECGSATPAGDHYFCLVGQELQRFESDGTLTWSAPGLQPAVPEDSSRSRLVALTEPEPQIFDVWHVDTETGAVGDLVYSFVQQPGVWVSIVLPPQVYAAEDTTLVVGSDRLIALDDDGSLQWALPHEEGLVGSIMTFGDVAVLDGARRLLGVDVATGEVIWERTAPGEPWRVGGDLVAIRSDRLTLLELP